MTHITCRLTAKNRDQLRNPTLGNRVWATFTFFQSTVEYILRVELLLLLQVSRSRSDASDVVARISHWRSAEPLFPRAHESLSLLVTERRGRGGRVVVYSSDARSQSSDSTFTGGAPATARDDDTNTRRRRPHTMRDRAWHRDLVAQYRDHPRHHAAAAAAAAGPAPTPPPSAYRTRSAAATTAYAVPASAASSRYPVRSTTTTTVAFSALTLSVGRQEGHPACKNIRVVRCWCGYLSGARCRLALWPS